MGKLGTMLEVGRVFGVRDGMLRLGYEVQRGSGLMSWRMRSVQGWESWELKDIAPESSAEALLAARCTGERRFFFADAKALGTNVRRIIGSEGEKSLIAEAEKILAGTLPFFGELSHHCGFPPRWFQNTVTRQKVSPKQSWTQMRFASPVYGDMKFILEPSRFLFVYWLVRAYSVSGDERFPRAFWAAIEDWARYSPPMSGPLWICGQECSLRILSWSFGLHGFIQSPSTTPERVALLISMIAAHAWRTAQTLDYARSQRSNHLVTEAVGLWAAGTLYPELAEAQVWRNLGAHLLQEAVLDQVTPQGSSHQHSLNYQRMILHLLLWTIRLAEIHGVLLHEEIRARAQAAFDFMRSWVDPVSGCAPNYGANDGSLILPLSTGAYGDYRPLLQLGAAVLNRPALPPGSWDEPALWFGVEPRMPVKPTVIRQSAAETGYFRLGNENSWAMIRAGQYARRPFQADQLHADLWWHGFNIAPDAGTYLYNGPAPWNNAFAGSAVHNTVTVDHRDQMHRAGRFLWLDWAQASGRLYSSDDKGYADRFEGEHDGYQSLGVKHRRTVQWLAGSGWVIVDDLSGTGEHDLRLHWLTADLPYEVRESPFEVVFASGKAQIQWSMFASAPAHAVVIRAGAPIVKNSRVLSDDMSLLGWEAQTYGDLRPAVSLVYQTRSQLPVRFVTVILTDDQCELESANGELVIFNFAREGESHGKSEIYRESLSPPGTSESAAPFSPIGIPLA
jgi:Heparinase II/III-like protein/Heparinase II/III N-terminus